MSNKYSKNDAGWIYAIDLGGSATKCTFCGKIIRGGGITRFKGHLAHTDKNVSRCKEVPPSIKKFMLDCLTETTGVKKSATDELGPRPTIPPRVDTSGADYIRMMRDRGYTFEDEMEIVLQQSVKTTQTTARHMGESSSAHHDRGDSIEDDDDFPSILRSSGSSTDSLDRLLRDDQ